MAFFKPPAYGVPDYLGDTRQQIPNLPFAEAPKKKGGFFKQGGAGLSILGYIGDSLAGNSNYAEGIAQQQQATLQEQLAARRREEEMAEWIAKEKYKAENQGADLPGIAKEERYWRSIGRDDIADDIVAKHRMTAVSQADPATGEVRYQYVRPSQLMGPQTDNIPTIASEAELERLPPGAQFRAPDGSLRRKGASPSNGSAGFPRPY